MNAVDLIRRAIWPCVLLLIGAAWFAGSASAHAKKNTNTIYNSGQQCVRITGVIGHGHPIVSRGETKSRSGGCSQRRNKAAGNIRQKFYSYKRVSGNYYLCRESALYVNGSFTWIVGRQRDWNRCAGSGRYKTMSLGGVYVNSIGGFAVGSAWSPGHNF